MSLPYVSSVVALSSASASVSVCVCLSAAWARVSFVRDGVAVAWFLLSFVDVDQCACSCLVSMYMRSSLSCRQGSDASRSSVRARVSQRRFFFF
jgi:hypothetical protein